VLDVAFLEALQDLGFGGLAVFALVANFRGWFVWRREHDALKADRDYYRSRVDRSLDHADQAIQVAEKVAKRA